MSHFELVVWHFVDFVSDFSSHFNEAALSKCHVTTPLSSEFLRYDPQKNVKRKNSGSAFKTRDNDLNLCSSEGGVGPKSVSLSCFQRAERKKFCNVWKLYRDIQLYISCYSIGAAAG